MLLQITDQASTKMWCGLFDIPILHFIQTGYGGSDVYQWLIGQKEGKCVQSPNTVSGVYFVEDCKRVRDMILERKGGLYVVRFHN